MTSKIWILAEHQEGEFNPIVAELLTEAEKLKYSLGCESQAVVLASSEGLPQLSLLREYGSDTILLNSHNIFNEYDADLNVQVLDDAAHQYKPRIILVGETSTGTELARRLATRLEASFVPEYTHMEVQGDSLVVTRLVFSGKIGAKVIPLHEPLVATLKPGVIRTKKSRIPGIGKVEEMKIVPIPKQKRVQVIERYTADAESLDLREADIVVGAGKGLGSDDGFVFLQELARELNARVGGTRRAVDKGWISSEDQIGQTGQIISPRLYIAVGISGTSHHVVGIRDANLIIAINTDRNAPIFTLSNLGVIGDAKQVLPAIVKCLKSLEK